jgi:hypothetical protein
MDSCVTGMRKMRNIYQYLLGYPTVNVSLSKPALMKYTYWRYKNEVWIYVAQDRKIYNLLRTKQ